MKKNFLFILSYSANSFRKNYKTHIDDDNIVKKDLRKFLISFFKQEPAIKFAVDTAYGTNALMNAASIQFPLKIEINLHNSRKFNNVLNFKIRDKQLGFKILNIFNVSDNFCINRAALHSKYVFRFTTHKYDHLDIFEYPILSKLKHNIYMENLEKNLKDLNLFCEKNNLIMFSSEENFLRRKLSINPIRLKLVKSAPSYVVNSSPIFLIEIENFPISQVQKISNFLEAIFINSREKSTENFWAKIEPIFKAEDISKFDQNKSIEDLNGLFLTDISFDKKIIEHENLRDTF